jgi:hypothetical protein
VSQYGSLIAWNTTTGWVGNTKAGENIDAAYVSNEAGQGVQTTGSDVLTQCPASTLQSPAQVTAENVNNEYVMVSWQDNGSGEIGFRIDRKTGDGEWNTIAYRPRKNQGSGHNEQKWHDYLAPRGQPLTYRVAAINCADTDNALSAVVQTSLQANVTGAVPKTVFSKTVATSLQIHTSESALRIHGISGEVQVHVFDCKGARYKGIKQIHPGQYDISGLSGGMYLICIKNNHDFRNNHIVRLFR